MFNITSHELSLNEVQGNWENQPGYELGKLYHVFDDSRLLLFTSGGVLAIAVGDRIVGATSGATARVDYVGPIGTTWAGGACVGCLRISQQVGTFVSENLDTATQSNIATIAADSVLQPGLIAQVMLVQVNAGSAAASTVPMGAPLYPTMVSGVLQKGVVTPDSNSTVPDTLALCAGILLASADVTDLYFAFMQLSGIGLGHLVTENSVDEDELLLADTGNDGQVVGIAAIQAVNEGGSATFTVYNAGNPNVIGFAHAADVGANPYALTAGLYSLDCKGAGLLVGI